MDAPFKKYITTLRRAKKKRRQFACVVTAMSVVVSGGVFWQLRRQGTAISDETAPAAELPEAAIPVGAGIHPSIFRSTALKYGGLRPLSL